MQRQTILQVLLVSSVIYKGSRQDSVECEKGHFGCLDLCIPQKHICDGIQDCEDNSDEMNCVDGGFSSYVDNLYKKQPSAEHEDYDKSCALRYNGSCKCVYRFIFCTHKGYTRAPSDILDDDIEILDFTGNNFKTLSSEVIKGIPRTTENLVLEHCDVREIRDGTFDDYKLLLELHLDNNFLRLLPAGVFPADSSLEVLTLGYNNIMDIDAAAFVNLVNLMELDLSYNQLSEITREVFKHLGNLTNLSLQGNKLRSLDSRSFPQFHFLSTLSLSDNSIEYLASGTFEQLSVLEHLYLSGNKLRYLSNGTFDGLSTLLMLTLDNNLLKDIDEGVFRPTLNLTSLDFRGNYFERLNQRVLKPLGGLKHIYFNNFEMCADAPHAWVCEPKGDGISSQEHLLDNVVLRASVWVMAGVGCAGNLIVFLGRLVGGPTNNVVHSLYIKNLALSDLLMGVYLFIIAGVDEHYRMEYIKHEWRWRHSTLCSLCGFLNTLSCESSVLILSLVTWDRFVSVTQPLARKQPSPKTAALTLLLLWTIAALVAAAPLLGATEGYFGKEFYTSNGLCLPLYLHNPFAKGWQYSVVMFMCINTIALAFICYAYIKMIHEIRASGLACRSTQQSHERDKVAQRFGIIVLTDCLCWVPVIIVKLMALAGMQFSEGYRKFIYATLAIYVLPINSALNPILYTLTTTLFKKQIRKFFKSFFRKRKPDPQNSGYDSACSMSLGNFPLGGSTRRVLTYRGTMSSLTNSKGSGR